MKVEYQTPSPPKGMPELPELPIPSEDESDILTDTPPRANGSYKLVNGTPANGNANGLHDFSSMKTPRPPGAWFATPAPAARIRAMSLSREGNQETDRDSAPYTPVSKPDTASSLPLLTPAPPGAWNSGRTNRTRAASLSRENSLENGVVNNPVTPVSALGRTSSLPAVTPAPPGAWMATPDSIGRKSQLKVRFDVESETSMSESNAGNSVSLSPMAAAQVKATDGLPPRPRTPEAVSAPAPVKRSPRKSPGIRVVDAWGREQLPPPHISDGEEESSPSSKRKSTVRIVDAMGREVIPELQPVPKLEVQASLEPEPQPDREPQDQSFSTTADMTMEGLTPAEVMARIRAGLSELARDINDADRSNDEILAEVSNVEQLDEISRTARSIRSKLSEALKMAKQADQQLELKFGSIGQNRSRHAMLVNCL